MSFPLGLAAESVVVPPDNPMTEEKIKLGKRLFFEKKLSTDQSISCASCHIPEHGFSDSRQFSAG
ncbi:MAG: cytochrome-c peroxidase, partial [Acidobacteria bacterium]